MEKIYSDGHYIYYYGQESLREKNGKEEKSHSQQESEAVLGCNLKKWHNDKVSKANHSISQ